MDLFNEVIIDLYHWLIYYPNCNLHYMQRYLSFCKKIKEQGNRFLDFYEKHHIIPKSVDKRYEHNSENIVEVTPREHYILHWILMRAVGGNMVYAFHRLTFGKNQKITNSKAYNELRINIAKETSNLFKNKPKSDEHKYKISMAQKGRKQSEETIQKRKFALKGKTAWNKGKKQSKETIQKREETMKNIRNSIEYGKKISKANQNRITIHKDNIEKHIKPEEVSFYLNNGWCYGAKLKNTKIK